MSNIFLHFVEHTGGKTKSGLMPRIRGCASIHGTLKRDYKEIKWSSMHAISKFSNIISATGFTGTADELKRSLIMSHFYFS